MWTVGEVGAPAGFYILNDAELYQFFMAAQARGQGVAQALLADAEQRARGAGVEMLWLACAIGNDRAARFYEKCGWHRAGLMISRLDTVEGPFELEVWRFEKCLGATPPPT